MTTSPEGNPLGEKGSPNQSCSPQTLEPLEPVEHKEAERFGLWRREEPRVALTIAGLDPSAGAGLIADLRTFDALGVYGMAVAATLTVQSTKGLYRRCAVEPTTVREQLETLFADRRPNAVKTGALGTRDVVAEVAYILKKEEYPGPLVIDPVIASGDGQSLIDADGAQALADLLLPHATIVTPNAGEVSHLCGFEVFDVKDMEAAALRLVAMGARAALITGGRMAERKVEYAADVLYDGHRVSVLKSPWIDGERIHGTGCVLSAGITASLAMGKSLKSAVNEGRRLVRASMENAVKPGHGAPSANPYAAVRLHAPARMKGGRNADRLRKRHPR